MKEYLSSLEEVLKEQNSSQEGLSTGEAQELSLIHICMRQGGSGHCSSSHDTVMFFGFLRSYHSGDPDLWLLWWNHGKLSFSYKFGIWYPAYR